MVIYFIGLFVTAFTQIKFGCHYSDNMPTVNRRKRWFCQDVSIQYLCHDPFPLGLHLVIFLTAIQRGALLL